MQTKVWTSFSFVSAGFYSSLKRVASPFKDKKCHSRGYGPCILWGTLWLISSFKQVKNSVEKGRGIKAFIYPFALGTGTLGTAQGDSRVVVLILVQPKWQHFNSLCSGYSEWSMDQEFMRDAALSPQPTSLTQKLRFTFSFPADSWAHGFGEALL